MLPRLSMMVRDLLERVRAGELDVAAAIEALSTLQTKEHGGVSLDAHRELRQGVPEVIFGPGKTPEAIVEAARALGRASQNVLVSRMSQAQADVVCRKVDGFVYDPVSRIGRVTNVRIEPRVDLGYVAVVTAGTSDIPVGEEAAQTLEALGIDVRRVFDVGIAGIHRLFERLEVLRDAEVVIAIAGMEGALPSVVGGLVSAPVIAVPTSIGYGSALNGFTPLFAMLTSCSSGISVVNIDNGFGAAFAARRIVAGRKRLKKKKRKTER
jgi:NCAIR mutase (PurE)-related protein